MARASGSYPAGRWFKSDIRYHSRLVGQAVKTRPFHGCNSGSIPLRVTNEKSTTLKQGGAFFISLVPRSRNRTRLAPSLTTMAYRLSAKLRPTHLAVRMRFETLPHRLPWRPCRVGQIPLRVKPRFALITTLKQGGAFFIHSSFHYLSDLG